MSLDSADLQAIRQVVSDELKPIESKAEALKNDVAEIYDILVQNGLKIVAN